VSLSFQSDVQYIDCFSEEDFIYFSGKNKSREVGCEGVEWVQLAQDRDQWRALVNTVRSCGRAGNNYLVGIKIWYMCL